MEVKNIREFPIEKQGFIMLGTLVYLSTQLTKLQLEYIMEKYPMSEDKITDMKIAKNLDVSKQAIWNRIRHIKFRIPEFNNYVDLK